MAQDNPSASDGLKPCEVHFANLLFEGKTQSAAFRLSHPQARRWKAETVHSEASRLANKVRARVERMKDDTKQQTIERAILTLEDHMAKLQELRDKAAATGSIAPAITAEVKRGELMGFYVSRSESVNTNFVISGSPEEDDANADAEDWVAKHRPN